MKSASTRFVLLCLLLASAAAGRAENWPQFRGPRGDGTSRETGLPLRWSATDHIRWKATVPGEGHSSPIVWNGAVFLTSADKATGERHLLRLDAASVNIIWLFMLLTARVEAMLG
jgi:hypothetical protein